MPKNRIERGDALIEYQSEFAIGDRVLIDRESAIVFVVTGVLFRKNRCQIEVSWFSNGDAKDAYFDEWRAQLYEGL